MVVARGKGEEGRWKWGLFFNRYRVSIWKYENKNLEMIMPQCSQTILLKLVKMVNFMLCKLYHNKKKSLKKVTLDLSSKLLTPCPNSTLAILANQQSNYPSLISFPHPSLQSNRKSINSNSRTYPNFVHPSSSLSSLQAYSRLRTT